MLRTLAVSILVAIGVSVTAAAQQHSGAGHAHHRPYAGLENRPIKALSDGQVADLRAGRGMGLALAAELNGYPGPKHVLEHSDALGLAPAQRAEVEKLFDSMRREAIPAGEELIAAEARLDRIFADGSADFASLDAAMREVAVAYAKLRRTHLSYHISTKAVLTPSQVATYNTIRGYAPK